MVEAALGMGDGAAEEGRAMAMTQKRWDSLSAMERDAQRDLSGLSPQLVGLEGYRVEVVDRHGETRRFYVGRSTGWKPCHLEVKLRTSTGGGPADREYRSVKQISSRRVR